MDELTVGDVAQRFGITVRTLHHYDDIGLLTPSRRGASGYRVYTSADLTRLSQVIVYRRLERHSTRSRACWTTATRSATWFASANASCPGSMR